MRIIFPCTFLPSCSRPCHALEQEPLEDCTHDGRHSDESLCWFIYEFKMVGVIANNNTPIYWPAQQEHDSIEDNTMLSHWFLNTHFKDMDIAQYIVTVY